MPGIFEIFGNSNRSQTGATPTGNQPANNGQPANGYQPAPSQLQQQNNNNQPNPPGNNGDPNAGNPNNMADPNKGAPNSGAPGSPLDKFNDLFKVDTDTNGQPIVVTDPMAQPLVQLDPAKLREAASKMNFTQGVSQELLQKATSGDGVALLQLINASAQNAFIAGSMATGSVVDNAVRTNNDRFNTVLPDRVREVQIRQTAAKHPALNHQSAVPMVEMMKAQVAAKNPTLSPDKVAEIAENYFIAMADGIQQSNQQNQPANRNGAEPDYSIFFPADMK